MKVLLIPSAILVPREMRGMIGELPTALYPLNGITMLEHICKKYEGFVDKIIVVGHQKHILIQDYVHWKKLPVEIVVTDKVEDLGYTINAGLQSIPEENVSRLYINFADTLLGDPIANGQEDIIYYANKELSDDWTFFDMEDQRVTGILDKKMPLPGVEYNKVFVGAFAFSDIRGFKKILAESVLEKEKDMDSFYKAIVEYGKKKAFSCVKVEKWFDVGHCENYYSAKTGVEARNFNSIEIDENRGILKKKSENVDKFLGEINWYVKMPKKLQYLLPRVYAYSLDRDNPYIEMEYYGYHTLHEMLIFGDAPLVRWQKIFRRLKFILNDMAKYTVKENPEDFRKALKEIYIDKTVNRLNSLRKQSEFQSFFKDAIWINGQKYRSLDEYIELFQKVALERLINNYDDCFSIIHGDLCFANMLIEENHNFVRTIDPRGEFGGYDIYGDKRYEYAKILHSLEGKYDYIIEDMFTVSREGNAIEIEIPNKAQDILQLFLDMFGDVIENMDEVRLIEASLFLSMIPLHSDHLERQYAMLVTGIKLFEQVLEG